MAKSNYILHLFLCLSFLQFSTASEIIQDKANDLKNYSNRILQTTGDITIPPNSINIANLFTISYTFQPAGFITMAIKFKIPNQYFAIGFGTEMVGADIWVFQIINSEIVVSDRVGLSRSSPKLDTTQGGTSDIERLGYEITSSYSLVKIRRALNTGDKNDAVISEGLVNMIYATGTTPTMSYHGKSGRGTVVVPLIQGVENFTTEDKSIEEKILIEKVHSLVNLIAWGAIADLAIILVRLMRGKKFAIGNLVISAQFIHAFLMWVAILMSITVCILMMIQNRKERGMKLMEAGDRDFHFINGLVILCLLLFVLISGGITLLNLKPYDKTRNSRFTVKMIHRVAGSLVYLLAKANIITGVLFHEQGKWMIELYVYLCVLLLIHVGMQIMYWYYNRNSNKSPSDIYCKNISISSTNEALLEAINKGMSRHEISKNFPKIKWVMLGNKVYNLTGWIHPGGNCIIEACIGREIGRYFYGNYSLEGMEIEPHQHSALTVSQLSSFYIGELTNYESIFYLKKGDKTTLSKATDKWKINKITPISDNISEISFRNPHFKVKNFGKSLSWLGRHFRISFDRNDSSARLYTTALSLNKANNQLRQNIYKYFDEVMSGNTSAAYIPDQTYLASQSCMSFFIKNYRLFEGFSNSLYRVKIPTPANKFRIEGPIGRGLELSPESSGTHCIICSGTGILPVIDFLNLFLWKTMYQLIKEKVGTEKARVINPLNIQFDDYFNGMSIKFIGAFSNLKETLGIDIIKKLAEINKKFKKNNFEAFVKGYSDENIPSVVGDFSSIDFLKQVVTKKESKFYVIGPPSFNEDIPEALYELGISQRKIMIV